VLVGMATSSFAQGRLAKPQMLSGNDLGFRVESIDLGAKAVGTWMVRYDGNFGRGQFAGRYPPCR
jgi:hypothetical protein